MLRFFVKGIVDRMQFDSKLMLTSVNLWREGRPLFHHVHVYQVEVEVDDVVTLVTLGAHKALHVEISCYMADG